MSKSVLLIGGTGTLSSAVLQCALDEGYDLTIMNRGTNNSKIPRNVKIVIGNFYNLNELNEKFEHKQYDVIVDFLSRIPSDIERSYGLFKDKCKQYIFISSACVYKRDKNDFPIKENSPKPNELWSYNKEKYQCEKRLMELSVGTKSYYTIVRPYITYNDERIPLGISPSYKYHRTIIERVKSGKPWFVWDDGKAITTLTYAEDFAVGVVGLFLNDKAKNNDFHITSDFRYTQREVVELLFKKLGMPLKIISVSCHDLCKGLPEFKQMLIGDRALDAVFDNSKIKNAVPQLNFSVSLDKGLDKIIDYWTKSSALYDYQFEGRLDSLLSKYDDQIKYIKYPNALNNSYLLYLMYRYLPIKVANKLRKWI